jgi:hypothetical protein
VYQKSDFHINSQALASYFLNFIYFCCYRAQQWWIIRNRKERKQKKNKIRFMWFGNLPTSTGVQLYLIIWFRLGLQHNIFNYNKTILYEQIWKTSKYHVPYIIVPKIDRATLLVLSYYFLCPKEYESFVLTISLNVFFFKEKKKKKTPKNYL